MIPALLDIERPWPGPRTVAVAEIQGELIAVTAEHEAVFNGALTPDEEARARAELARVAAYEIGRRT